jgi:hypothetical protein
MRSADGSNFSSIATISSLATGGNSSLILKYSFVDAQPLDGKSYYMLKQTDLDGRFTFSSVVVLETSGTEMFRFAAVFPNPTNSQLNLSIISPTKQDATVIINDMFGRTVTQRLISVSSGSNNYQINVNALPAGNYLLNVVPKDGSTNKALKFIKL